MFLLAYLLTHVVTSLTKALRRRICRQRSMMCGQGSAETFSWLLKSLDDSVRRNCCHSRSRLISVHSVQHWCLNDQLKSVISGVARNWCQEGHKVVVFISFVVIRPISTIQYLLGVYKRSYCQHIVAVRLCIGQSRLKKINCCRSRGGARAPVPHSWRRQCLW